MPVAKFQMPDGRIGRFEVPEGTSPEQAQSMIAASIGGQQEPQERSWGDVAMSAIGNIPSSGAGIVKGIYEAVSNPVETAKGVYKLGKGAVQHALPESIVGSDEEAKQMASQVGQFYKQRYGTMQGFKEALATDPVGVLADVSTVATGGGAAAAKIPLLAKAGQVASTVGRSVDPLVMALRGTEKAISGAGKIAEKGLGMTTGVGSEPILQAYRAGSQGGGRQASFIENLRGEVPVQDVLEPAKADLSAMGRQQKADYRADMQAIRGDKSVLDFGDIDKALADAAGRTQFKGQVIKQGASNQVEKARELVDNWKNLDPAEYHTPEGLDALKQQVGDILESIPFEQKNARSAVGEVYNSIKSTINNQAPKYAEVMKDYSTAADTIKEIERALSLGQKSSADTAMRKLQSLMRNNVQTNYGNRLNLAKELEQAGGRPIMPALAGQALSEWTPRGMQRVSALPTAGGAYLMGEPMTAGAYLAASSPRLAGEASLKAGQIARLLRNVKAGANMPFNAVNADPRVIANLLYQAGVNTQGNQ